MKLLYVHNSDFSSEGANRFQVSSMCKAFRENNLKLSLLSFVSKKNHNKNINLNNIDFIKLKFNQNYYFNSLSLFLKFTKIRKKYDIIYTRDIIFTFLVKLFYGKKCNIIYESHQIINSKLWFFLFKYVFKRTKFLVVISEGIRDELIKLGFDVKKIVVLHDGVDLERYQLLKNDKIIFRNQFNLPKDRKIIMYVGSLESWKGVETLLESSNILNEEYLIVVGGGEVIQINEYKKIYNKVLFLGKTSFEKLPYYLKSADVLVLPNSSKFEISVKYTSPLKLFEYMASKVPIVASDLPSLRNIVSDGEVIFFKSDDSNDLKEKIQNIINDTNLSNTITKNAFKKVKNYTWKKRAKEILELFGK